MATNKTYVSDGSQTIYTFDFDYISADFVKVLVDGVEVNRTLSGTYQVTLDAAPAAGAVINITRQTDTDRIVEFVDGSILVAKDLNLSALQATHIAAEAFTAATGSLLIDDSGAFSAGGRRITRTGEPVADDDVVTKGWVNTTGNTFIDATEAAQAAAEDARDQAQAARDTATVRRDEARTARDTAEAHRDDAETYRDEARAARDTAEVRRDEAETHKVGAEAAQTAAEAALASTEQIETDIGDLRADGDAAIAECQNQVGLAQTESSNAAASAAAAAQSAANAAAAAGFDPADYADADHTHAWDEITDKPDYAQEVDAQNLTSADNLNLLTEESDQGWYKWNGNPKPTNAPQTYAVMLCLRDQGRMHQIVWGFDSAKGCQTHQRRHTSGVWSAWSTQWSDTNDGPGSGLDADTVDGLHAASFVRGDAADNGAVTIRVNDADFILSDATDTRSSYFWRDHSARKLYFGTDDARPITRYDIKTESGDAYIHEGYKADQTQAEAGTDDTQFMTPLRTKEAIELGSHDFSGDVSFYGTVETHANTDVNGLMRLLGPGGYLQFHRPGIMTWDNWMSDEGYLRWDHQGAGTRQIFANDGNIWTAYGGVGWLFAFSGGQTLLNNGYASRYSSGGLLRASTSNDINFHWNNGFYYSIDGNPYVLINASASDEKLKDIEGEVSVDEAIEKINGLAPIAYEFKDGLSIDVAEGRTLGFSAQNVQAVMPNGVREAGMPVDRDPDEVGPFEESEKFLALNDSFTQQTLASLVVTSQHLLKEVEALRAENSSLVARIQTLEAIS